MCKQHRCKGKAICLDCGEIVICVFCCNRNHRSHHHLSLEEYAGKTKQSFVSLLEEEKTKFTQSGIFYAKEVEKIKSFREELAKELKLRKLVQLNDFYSKLETEEKKILKEVDVKIDDFMSRLKKSNLLEESYEGAITNFLHDLTDKTDSSIVIERKAVLERIDNLSSLHCFTAILNAAVEQTNCLGGPATEGF